MIREAVLRELEARRPRCTFLHNEVETIENRRAKLRRSCCPEARIAVAHGQMPERELEKRDARLRRPAQQLLLCSTIIETGIDVPTANTIVMSRADSSAWPSCTSCAGAWAAATHQAYAYLLVPDVEGLTKQAQQRLDAIQQMEELGSGFYLAMHDLGDPRRRRCWARTRAATSWKVGFSHNEMLARRCAA